MMDGKLSIDYSLHRPALSVVLSISSSIHVSMQPLNILFILLLIWQYSFNFCLRTNVHFIPCMQIVGGIALLSCKAIKGYLSEFVVNILIILRDVAYLAVKHASNAFTNCSQWCTNHNQNTYIELHSKHIRDALEKAIYVVT